MATKIGRIDRGERPTVSQGHPDETRPYDGRVRQNLFNTEHIVPSRRYKDNYDKINWDKEGEDPLD